MLPTFRREECEIGLAFPALDSRLIPDVGFATADGDHVAAGPHTLNSGRAILGVQSRCVMEWIGSEAGGVFEPGLADVFVRREAA